MKKFLVLVATVLLLVCGTADARLGGKSFGKQMTVPTMRAPAAKPAVKAPAARQSAPAKAATPTPAPKPMSPWKSALFGVAGALGFMALAHALGLGEAAGSMLMVVAVVILGLMLFAFLRSRKAPAPAQAAAGRWTPAPGAPEPERPAAPAEALRSSASGVAGGSVMDEFYGSGAADTQPAGEPGYNVVDLPADFDEAAFLEGAKQNYMRLQQAWCTGNVAELSAFTTEDVFIAVTHQLHQRGATREEISCVELDAKLLAVQENGKEYVASVMFTGTLRVNGELESLKEIWNLVKPMQGKGGWLLAGIQTVDGEANA